MMHRRKFIKLIGTGASGLVLGASLSSCTESLMNTPDLAWHIAGSDYQDPMRRALSYAILAPNPHNRQPWLVRLDQQALSLRLYCEMNRRLPETDPFDRQILIGLGCFTELLRMAAAEDNFATDIRWFPEGMPEERLDRRAIAEIKFIPSSQQADPLFKQIVLRRSNKEPFDMEQKIQSKHLETLRAQTNTLGLTTENNKVSAIRELTWQGHAVEMNTPRTLMESVNLMRVGTKQVAQNPDGIDLGGTMMTVMKKIGIMSPEKLADSNSMAFQQGMDVYQELHSLTPAFAWIMSPANTRMDQLKAGMDYVRLNLKATELGIAMHPVSQVLQEYSEMSHLYEEIHKELSVVAPARIQMLVRMGIRQPTPPSPRWPLESRIGSSL